VIARDDHDEIVGGRVVAPPEPVGLEDELAAEQLAPSIETR